MDAAAGLPEDRSAAVSAFALTPNEVSPSEITKQRVFKRGAGGNDDIEEAMGPPSKIAQQFVDEDVVLAQQRQAQERLFKRGNAVYEEHGSDGELIVTFRLSESDAFAF